MIGAIGVVFGDIGTSPLYALQAVFGRQGQHVAITQANVQGIISLVIWSITLVVSIKFVFFIMRADNGGEGGILALVALIKSSKLKSKRKWLYIALGLIGASLFYGDSVITPAISVLSAVEGLNVISPNLSHIVLPLTLVMLTALFWVQKYGTGLIGRIFGPVMLTWFIVIAAAGGYQVWLHPEILRALLPTTALIFFLSHPLIAFFSMTAVVLAITGAEALYADLGHFGRPPIARAWFFIVFPALAICYMGQGSLILHNSRLEGNLLVQMFPSGLRIPFVILATLATLIASQSVISGAFSLTRQAVQLNFLPKMLIKHTSYREIGQIYLPFINFLLFVAVTLLVVTFGASENLANAYGIAVSGTLAADTILFMVVVGVIWKKPASIIFLTGLAFLPLDIIFVSANTSKIFHGGLFPVFIGAIIFIIIKTWLSGEKIVSSERIAMEGPLQDFIDKIHNADPAIIRNPGTAVYISHHPDFAPLALHATVEELHELPEKVVIISVIITTAAHVPEENRVRLDSLKYSDGISHIVLSYGFHDSINVPNVLKSIRNLSPELDFDVAEASYFISLGKVVATNRHNMSIWSKNLYFLLARNARSTSDYYKLPSDRTEEMSTLLKL
ncbi:MAG: potassium transporter Kup [Candidatus Saccharimonadales bacterium]